MHMDPLHKSRFVNWHNFIFKNYLKIIFIKNYQEIFYKIIFRIIFKNARISSAAITFVASLRMRAQGKRKEVRRSGAPDSFDQRALFGPSFTYALSRKIVRRAPGARAAQVRARGVDFLLMSPRRAAPTNFLPKPRSSLAGFDERDRTSDFPLVFSYSFFFFFFFIFLILFPLKGNYKLKNIKKKNKKLGKSGANTFFQIRQENWEGKSLGVTLSKHRQSSKKSIPQNQCFLQNT